MTGSFAFYCTCLAVLVMVLGIFMNSDFCKLVCKNSYHSCKKSYHSEADITDSVDKTELLVDVCVLSARENFDARQAIRETWMKLVKEKVSSMVNVHFVVGKSCDIHPENRLDVNHCQANDWSYLPKTDNLPLVSVLDLNSSQAQNVLISNMSLLIKHPIVINKLGVNAKIQLSNTEIKVYLHDDFRDEEIAGVRFTAEDQGREVNGFRYQSVESVLLPEGFQGSLRIIVSDKNWHAHQLFLEPTGQWRISNYGGAVYSKCIDNDKVVDVYFTNCVFLSSFLGTVFDVEKFNLRVAKKHILNQQWMDKEEKINILIDQESQKYSDIIFIDVIDVYRNLPLKLLKFHKWLNSEVDYRSDFIIKTDDDCFLDIEEVVTRLAGFNGTKKLWWSNFRDDWFVERYGKWSEHEYKGSTYPRFACGSGNLVSRDISQWLAMNYDYLKPYQGEDVSMGIWLSAVGPNYIVDGSWQCDKSCTNDSLVIPELSPAEMRETWQSRLKCRNPCGCE